MTTEQLNNALYRKMSAEQESFRAWLLSQPPGVILNHAYEYIVREDILLSFEENDLDGKQAAALLRSPTPIADIYREWGKRESDYLESIRVCTEDVATGMAKAAEKKNGAR